MRNVIRSKYQSWFKTVYHWLWSDEHMDLKLKQSHLKFLETAKKQEQAVHQEDFFLSAVPIFYITIFYTTTLSFFLSYSWFETFIVYNVTSLKTLESNIQILRWSPIIRNLLAFRELLQFHSNLHWGGQRLPLTPYFKQSKGRTV